MEAWSCVAPVPLFDGKWEEGRQRREGNEQLTKYQLSLCRRIEKTRVSNLERKGE